MSGSVKKEEDKKSADQPSPFVNLKVKANNDDSETFFRLRRNTQLKKLMNAYCERKSVELNTFVFLFDGHQIHPKQTADELELEDGDEIDAMLHQDGGGWVYAIL